MKIGYFCPHSDPLADLGEPDAGGQCVYEAKVAKALSAASHTVDCFTRLYGKKSAHSSISNGAEVYRVPMGDKSFMRKEDMSPWLASFAHNAYAEHRETIENCDIYHGHYWDGGVAALNASIMTAKPFVFTSHSLGILKRDRVEDDSLNYPIRIAAEHKVMQASDRIIALSTVEKDALLNRYHIPEHKISIVPGGVDVASFAPRADKATLKKKHQIETDYCVLTVGRLDARKGFLQFLDTVKPVVESLKKQNKTVTFLIPKGGSDLNPEEQALLDSILNKIETLGISEHIHLFGRPDDETLQDYYAAADVFACPSVYEPFGLVLVEAMAARTAVVSTNRGGPNDIISEGKDGFLADPENATEFSDAILKILSAAPEAQSAMHDAALAKAKTTYDWPAIGRQIADVYQSVIDDQRSSSNL